MGLFGVWSAGRGVSQSFNRSIKNAPERFGVFDAINTSFVIGGVFGALSGVAQTMNELATKGIFKKLKAPSCADYDKKSIIKSEVLPPLLLNSTAAFTAGVFWPAGIIKLVADFKNRKA